VGNTACERGSLNAVTDMSMVTADEPGLVTPHAAARNTEAEASQIVRERTNGSMKFREHSELRGPWCAQIVRRQIAYV